MFHLLQRFFRLYGPGFCGRFIFTTALAIIAGIFETFGLLLIYWVLGILLEPEIISRNGYLRAIYNILGLSEPRYLAAVLALCIMGVFILKNLYMVWFTRIQLHLMRDWKVQIRGQLMRYYMQSPYMLFLQQSPAILLRNIDYFSIRALDEVILALMNLFVNAVIAGIILIITGARYLWYLIPMAVATSITAYFLYRLLRHKLYVLGQEEQRVVVKERKALSQSFDSIKETKVSNAEEFFVAGFAAVNRELMTITGKTAFYQRIPPFVLEMVVIICIMGIGVGVVVSGDGPAIVASLGIMAAVAFRLAPLASRIVGALNSMSSNKAHLEIIVKEAEMPDFFAELYLPQVDKLPLRRNLKLENVCFRYPASKSLALRGIDLTIARGELIGIVGASGAGKSTFADLLLGLLEPQQGRILVDDIPLGPDNVRNWRASIGYVPQAIVLMDVPVREIVAFGVNPTEIDDQRVEWALARARLWDFIQTLPGGIHALAGEGGRNFSGGQRQRMAIARALYRNVEVLVLDEATSALDNVTEFAVASAIESLRGECSILVIAHRLSTLKRSDRILFFRAGELVDSGSFAELSRHKDFEHMLEVSKIEL